MIIPSIILTFSLLYAKGLEHVLPITKFVHMSISLIYRAFVSLSSVSIPQSWKEALADPEWKHAMVEEVRALIRIHVGVGISSCREKGDWV